MSDIVIKSHNFELAKSKIQKFSNDLPANPSFKKVDAKSGPFGWFDHKVTGAELNDHISSVQNSIISLNSTNRSIVKEFGEIYKALDALDKDYIQEILIAQKSAEKANSEVREAQQGINRSVEAIKATVDALKRFKAEITSEMSSIKAATGVDPQVAIEADARIKSMEKNLDELLSFSSSTQNEVDKLINSLSRIHHLDDVDNLWNDIASVQSTIKNHIANYLAFCDSFNDSINTVNKKISTLDDSLSSQSSDIKSLFESKTEIENAVATFKAAAEADLSSLKDSRNTLEKQVHLHQIDTLWDQTALNTDKHDQLDKAVASFKESAEADLSSLKESRSILEKQTHLHHIDTLWSSHESLKSEHDDLSTYSHESVDNHQTLLDTHNEEIRSINDRLDTFLKKYEEDRKELSKRVMISHIIGGVALVSIIVLYILNFCKVL